LSNLLNLPQIAPGTSIEIAANADWTDQFYIAQPGFPAAPISITGTLTDDSATVGAIASTSNVVPGMVAVGYGIPPGTTVEPDGSNALTLSNEATVNFTGASITLYPPPLDLTGISFTSMLRPSLTSAQALLKMSTGNGLMVNGGTSGQFGWQVPAASLPNWPPGLAQTGELSCVLDIQATDETGAIVDLCVAGPIPVTVTLPVTR
jgi:hypothetical protein